MTVKKFIIIFGLLLVCAGVVAQPKSNAEMTDSILAVLPQLHGIEKMEAIASVIRLNIGLPAQKRYVKMFLEETGFSERTFYKLKYEPLY